VKTVDILDCAGDDDERTATAGHRVAAATPSQFLSATSQVARLTVGSSQESRPLRRRAGSGAAIGEAHCGQERRAGGAVVGSARHATWNGRSPQDGRDALRLCMFHAARRRLQLPAACQQQRRRLRKVCTVRDSRLH